MSDTYVSYKTESMGIAYSVGKEIASKLVDQIDAELKCYPRPDAAVLRDLSEALRNCLAVTGSKQAEEEFLADKEKDEGVEPLGNCFEEEKG